MTEHYSEPEMNTKETSNLYQQLHYSVKLASVNLESLNLSFYLESRLIEGFLQPAQYNFFFSQHSWVKILQLWLCYNFVGSSFQIVLYVTNLFYWNLAKLSLCLKKVCSCKFQINLCETKSDKLQKFNKFLGPWETIYEKHTYPLYSISPGMSCVRFWSSQ